MRKLIHIPIVHEDRDIGIPTGCKGFITPAGEVVLLQKRPDVSSFWDEAEHEIYALDLDWSRVRIYQEALFDSDQSMNVVNVMAKAGSKNAIIIQKLLQRGATLELELEDPKIIEELVWCQDAIFNALTSEAREAAIFNLEQVNKRTLGAREAFIAKRIAETLKDGETGILFIGASHNITSKLPPNIQVNLLDRPFKRWKESKNWH